MNRFNRIVAILIHLQSKRIVTAQEIADRFEVSLRTVYRDIRSLEEAGVPIVSEGGVGYSIMEGYRLPPVIFTREEALTLITAEKLMARYTDQSLSSEYRSAITKIRAVLRSADKSYLEEAEENIAVLSNRSLPNRNQASQQIVINCITSKTMLGLIYFANHSQERTERLVEPVGMFHMAEAWHVIAYCHLRKDYRDFRVDRMLEVRPTGMPFQRKHPPLVKFLERFDTERELQEVVIRIPRDRYSRLGDQKYYMGFVSHRVLDRTVEMRFLTSSLEGFARWCLMFADYATIVKPEALQDKIANLASEVLKKFLVPA